MGQLLTFPLITSLFKPFTALKATALPALSARSCAYDLVGLTSFTIRVQRNLSITCRDFQSVTNLPYKWNIAEEYVNYVAANAVL